jgi:hypothetical protein
MTKRYHLVLNEDQMQTIAGSLFATGQITMDPSKFFHTFIQGYSAVYGDSDESGQNAKEHLFSTREILPERLDEGYFFATLFKISRMLLDKEGKDQTYSIPNDLDAGLNELIESDPKLRQLSKQEMINWVSENREAIIKVLSEGEKNND